MQPLTQDGIQTPQRMFITNSNVTPKWRVDYISLGIGWRTYKDKTSNVAETTGLNETISELSIQSMPSSAREDTLKVMLFESKPIELLTTVMVTVTD